MLRRCGHFMLKGAIHPSDASTVETHAEAVRRAERRGLPRARRGRQGSAGSACLRQARSSPTWSWPAVLAFWILPKDTALAAITALKTSGVTVKILTGDSES